MMLSNLRRLVPAAVRERLMSRHRSSIGAVLALLTCTTFASAAADDLVLAIRAVDTPTLAAWSDRAGATQVERDLAEAVLAALHARDNEAARRLLAVTDNGSAPEILRASAWLSLYGVRLRQGLYADAAAAMETALALGADPEASRRAGNEQLLRQAAALSGVVPMSTSRLTVGELPVERDPAGLARIGLMVNGARQRAVVDTGASFSVAAESVAQRLGLRVLDGPVAVSSSSVDSLAARFAVADSLSVGAATFRNVVFIVLPDSALTFAGGAYRIEVILGLPVALQLRRLEFRRTPDGETLRYGPSPAVPDGAPNLVLASTIPFVLADAQGAGSPLLMQFDTGARTTELADRAAADHPALAAETRTETAIIAGAGGQREETIRIAPRVVLSVSGLEVPLAQVRIVPHHPPRHGTLGQDVLGAASGYVIDFQAMRFELLR